MRRSTIAQGLLWYLPPTMGYLYDQLVGLGPSRSVVFAVQPWQPERFPFERVFFPPGASERPQLSPVGEPLDPEFYRSWAPVAREEKVGLLHVHDGRIAPRFLPLARELGVPLVTTFLGRDVTANLEDAEYRISLGRLFAEGERFTVMSRFMAKQVEALGCPGENIHVVHHGVSLTRFSFAPRRPPKEGPVVILTAGRLIPKKGPHDLARAFVRLCRHHANLELRFVGDGPMRGEVEAILSGGGVRERAQFLGMLAPETMAAEMARAHLFCLPSRVGPDGDSEGIPNTVKEAMASGLPVVSTYHAGIPELVENGKSGYLVSEGDITGIADRLECLLREPERWEAMGRSGRTKVEAEFSLDHTVRQLVSEVYRPLLDVG